MKNLICAKFGERETQQSSGYIQRRFDYFFKSNVSQEYVKHSDALAAFSTDD